MKRVLGVASITILVTLAAQAGLVTDKGIGINRAPRSKPTAAPVVDPIPELSVQLPPSGVELRSPTGLLGRKIHHSVDFIRIIKHLQENIVSQ